MSWSKPSIFALMGVLVALFSAILTVINAARRSSTRPTHDSPARHQYNFSHTNLSASRASSRLTGYNADDVNDSPSNNPPRRRAAGPHLQHTSPVILAPTPPATVQTLVQPPPPTYQPLRLRAALVNRM